MKCEICNKGFISKKGYDYHKNNYHTYVKSKYMSKEWLYNRYVNDDMSALGISKELGVSELTIRRWLMKFGIHTGYHHNHIRLTNELLEFLNGELLGDGHLYANMNKDRMVSVKYIHGTKHKKYLEWLSKKFSKFGLDQSGIIYERISKLYDNYYKSYKYTTKSYVELIELKKMWYPNGKKVIPEDLKLTPITVRQWYIGDGCLVKPKKGNPWIQLSTDGYLYNDVDILVDKLSKININATHRISNNRIAISTHSVEQFFKYIGDCPREIKDIYGYKWIE